MSLLQEIKVPLIAVNDTSLSVVDKPFANGDAIRKGDIILVFETSKTTYEVPAEHDGFIQYLCETGNDYEVNDIVALVHSEADEILKHQPAPRPLAGAVVAAVQEKISEWKGDAIFSSDAENLIAQHKIDRALFAGQDLVSKADVEALLGIKTQAIKKQPATARAKPATTVDHSKVIVEKLTGAKKREIEYLSEVQSTGLTSTINTFVDTEGLFVHVNKSLNLLKNSLLPLVIYEASRLLKKFPRLNAYFTGDSIAQYQAVNVGFAADMGQGLKVLKVADANEKSLHETESAIIELSERYLDNRLSVEDLTDITFTITDLSAEGVSFFRPLVNQMNSAILGISSIDEQLKRCTFTVTFDHRVTEGKTVAQFLQQLKARLETYRGKARIDVNSITCYKCSKLLAEDLGKIAFVKCVVPDGREGYICQSCLKGF